MVIVRTWLLVAAERREFDGIRKRMGNVKQLAWPGAKFACEADWQGDRWWMLANGPGQALVLEALKEKKDVDGMISTGLCGALDPALCLGDVVVSADARIEARAQFVPGAVHSIDHVAVTAAEKLTLRNQTGAIAVDMESAAVESKAAEWNVPYLCIRAVSDRAGDTLPLDFNRYRNERGDFSRIRIALAAIARPFTVMPQLMEFDRNCRRAADALGDFLADCRF
jgi:adenosylhomocysteine nucleosidase